MDVRRVRSLWGAGFLAFWVLFVSAGSLLGEGSFAGDLSGDARGALRALERSRAALIEARRAVDEALAEVDAALALVRSACQAREEELAGAVIEETEASREAPIRERAAKLLRDLWQRTEEAASRAVEVWKSKVAEIREFRARIPENREEETVEFRTAEEEAAGVSAAPAVLSDSAEGVQPAAETEAEEAELEAPWWEPLWPSEPRVGGGAEAAAEPRSEEPWWEPVTPDEEKPKDLPSEDPMAPPRRPEDCQGWTEP